ncbi:MAG: LuxR C-terminal-related transcriptional regulator [Dehalococcoidia bacterium]
MGQHAPEPPREFRYATSRDGTRVAWAEQGSGEAVVVAPPMFFLMTLNQGWIDAVQTIFDGRIIYYDRRGFGRSQHGVNHSVEHYADDLEAVIESAGVQSARVCAFMGGSMDALTLARRSGHISRAFFDEPIFGGPVWRAREGVRTMHAWLDIGFAHFCRELAQFFFGLGTIVSTEIVEHLMDSTSPEDVYGLLTAVEAVDLRTVAPEISLNCLVLHNRGETMAPASHAEELAQLLPNSRLLVGSGSRFKWDAATIDSVRKFLAEGRNGQGHDLRSEGHIRESRLVRKLLSPREAEILELVAGGVTNAEIAETLTLSRATVARHLANIYVKLGVRNRVEATTWALDRASG